MQRYFIYLSYDGTNYHGWQIQPNGNSVQEELEKALSLLLRTKTEIVGAGRTDAGVHARLMVAHFDYEVETTTEGQTAKDIDCPQLCYKLNRLLPRDISIRKIIPVAQDMHARFSAVARTYHYYIHTGKMPFERHYSYQMPYALDFDAMREGCELLKRQTDFAAFCKAGANTMAKGIYHAFLNYKREQEIRLTGASKTIIPTEEPATSAPAFQCWASSNFHSV